MKITLERYEFSHGRKPRGKGLWAVEVTGTDEKGSFTKETYFIAGNLSDARKEAARRLKQDCDRVKRIAEIVVLP